MHAMRKKASVVSLIPFIPEFKYIWNYFGIKNTIRIEKQLSDLEESETGSC